MRSAGICDTCITIQSADAGTTPQLVRGLQNVVLAKRLANIDVTLYVQWARQAVDPI